MINRINMKMNYILIFQYDNFEYMDKNYIDLRKIIQINIWKWNKINIILKIFNFWCLILTLIFTIR